VITVATYNIHDAVGGDGHFAPTRIAEVIAEINAGIIALQEVGSHVTGVDMLAFLREKTGYGAVSGPTLLRNSGDYGNAVLTRYAVREVTRIDLNVPRREARGALDMVLDCDGSPLRVLATHLGLRPAERHVQIRRLLSVLETQMRVTTVLMGDLNEWFLWGRTLRWLHAHFKRTPSPPTFPARWPMFALDRIWVEPRHRLRRLCVHATPRSRIASDHLPVVAELDLS